MPTKTETPLMRRSAVEELLKSHGFSVYAIRKLFKTREIKPERFGKTDGYAYYRREQIVTDVLQNAKTQQN